MRKVQKDDFNKIIALANKWFSFTDEEDYFETIQPKLYKNPAFGADNTYIYEIDSCVAGIFSIYSFEYYGLKIVGIGTVCVNPDYRNQGILQKMFAFLEQEILPKYDLAYLFGEQKRYERYHFYKSGLYKTYRIKRKNLTSEIKIDISVASKKDEEVLYNIYKTNKKGITRAKEIFYDSLKTHNNDVILISKDKKVAGYLIYSKKTHTIKEIMAPDSIKIPALISLLNQTNDEDILVDESLFTEKSVFDNFYDDYRVSLLANLRVNDFTKVLEKLLQRKKNLLDGELSIKFLNKYFLIRVVNSRVEVLNVYKREDITLTERKYYQLIFGELSLYENFGAKNDLIRSWFPLELPVTMRSIDSI